MISRLLLLTSVILLSCSVVKNTQIADNCILYISFISKGSGIDREAKQNVISYIENYNKVHSLSITYETIRWGREGEVDFCFSLSELKKSKQNKFIQDLRELVKNKESVSITENTVKRKGLSIK